MELKIIERANCARGWRVHYLRSAGIPSGEPTGTRLGGIFGPVGVG